MKSKSITLSRIVREEITFYEDDFKTIEEFDQFVLELKSNQDFRYDTFYDNLDDDCEVDSSEVIIKE
jgi:hypothetical protein